MISNYDILLKFEQDFNFQGMFYQNDSPQQWQKYTNVSAVKVDAFSYTFSSLGFRCDEFDLESDLPLLFLGCSNTLGLGVPLDNVWAKIICNRVRQHTGKQIPYWNLAKNGSSIDIQFLLLEKFISKLKPKFIFFLIPPIYRRTFYYNKEFFSCNFNEFVYKELDYPRAISNLLEFYVDESSALFELHKYMLLINSLCMQHNTKLFYQFCYSLTEDEQDFFDNRKSSYSEFIELKTPFPGPVDRARDRQHHGPASHAIFAANLWKEVESYFNAI